MSKKPDGKAAVVQRIGMLVVRIRKITDIGEDAILENQDEQYHRFLLRLMGC
jgi:hypothetical protein